MKERPSSNSGDDSKLKDNSAIFSISSVPFVSHDFQNMLREGSSSRLFSSGTSVFPSDVPNSTICPLENSEPLSQGRIVAPERTEQESMHPIIQAASHQQDTDEGGCERLPAQYETSDELENEPECITEGGISPDLANPSPDHNLPFDRGGPSQESSSSESIILLPPQDDSGYLQVAIPTFSKGSTTTFGYQQALRNRIFASKIGEGGEYDPQKYTPTFVHDSLMLPGSLANALGKTSSADIIQRMTPALLPGFIVTKNSFDQCLSLVQSHDSTDYAQGMLVFGQGRFGRDSIHAHYRRSARRVKVQVQLDVVSIVPWLERDSEIEKWHFVRQKIIAHAWVTSKVHTDGVPWSLEECLNQESEEDGDLVIDPSAYGVEDGGVSVNCSGNGGVVGEMQDVVRKIRRGVCGSLDYERVSHGWGGW